MDQIIALKVPFRFGNVEDIIYPAVLLDDREMVLVDCGYTGFLPQMEKAFGEQGLNCGNLAKIVVTHHDHDHMGALADFKEKYPQIQVLAGCGEVPYIEKLKKALRLEQAERMQAGLPDDQKEFGKAFCEVLKRVKPAFVDSAVHGGDSFGWCGGCEIIDTPGHTPGHISLYLKQWKTVITGDAATVQNGRLVVANPEYADNLGQAQKSLEKLLALDADTYLCYHGGFYRKGKA